MEGEPGGVPALLGSVDMPPRGRVKELVERARGRDVEDSVRR